MKHLPKVTIVAIASTKVEKTVRAVKKSMRHLSFHEALLITDKPISLEKFGIRVVPIERLDYKGYNHFILFRLKDYIKTEFALIVQHDGFVVRPKEWREEFLSYDYIGAPWPKGLHIDKNGESIRVGNGGFSLRSKRLLNAPTELDLLFSDFGTGYYNEDGFICNHHRDELEKAGIKFAPVEIASIFSKEKDCDDSYPTPFGVHNPPKNKLARSAKKLIKRVLSKVSYHKKLLNRVVSSVINDIVSPKNALQEYRRNHKVYDVFTFLDELDLLEIRLNILAPYVDYFVIIEATETFSGKQKELSYLKHKDRFSKWHNKIIHYVTDYTPKDETEMRSLLEKINPKNTLDRSIIYGALTSDNVGKDKTGKLSTVWMREFYQKESIKKALVSLSDDDFCFVSDVDEIWNPHAKINPHKNHIFKLRQKMYAYYLNNRSSEPWIGPIATKYKNIKNNYLNHLRTERKNNYVYVRNGGWHFTNQGGADKIRIKLASYGHQEYNTPEIRSRLEKTMAENKDFIGRKFKFWKDEKDLPQYILENREKYKHMFK